MIWLFVRSDTAVLQQGLLKPDMHYLWAMSTIPRCPKALHNTFG